MAPKQTFRELVVWQKTITLAKSVYTLTQQMPVSEQFGLTNQIRRAVVSVPSNIAEGNARQTRKDYLRFLVTARGSLAELETQLILARELSFLPETQPTLELLYEVSRMLRALIESLRGQH